MWPGCQPPRRWDNLPPKRDPVDLRLRCPVRLLAPWKERNMNNQPMTPPPPRYTLKLSIWRNFTPTRVLALQDGKDSKTRLITPGFDLQEEVYSWSLREDILSGIESQNLRENLHTKLFDSMDPARPPSERPIALLDEFVEAALEAIESGGVEPIAVQNPPDSDSDTSIEINGLLALALHLKWLSRCFADRPGISVSVR